MSQGLLQDVHFPWAWSAAQVTNCSTFKSATTNWISARRVCSGLTSSHSVHSTENKHRPYKAGKKGAIFGDAGMGGDDDIFHSDWNSILWISSLHWTQSTFFFSIWEEMKETGSYSTLHTHYWPVNRAIRFGGDCMEWIKVRLVMRTTTLK